MESLCKSIGSTSGVSSSITQHDFRCCSLKSLVSLVFPKAVVLPKITAKEGLIIVDDSVIFLKACASKLNLAAVRSSVRGVVKRWMNCHDSRSAEQAKSESQQ